jgi:hypothetical protein
VSDPSAPPRKPPLLAQREALKLRLRLPRPKVRLCNTLPLPHHFTHHTLGGFVLDLCVSCGPQCCAQKSSGGGEDESPPTSAAVKRRMLLKKRQRDGVDEGSEHSSRGRKSAASPQPKRSAAAGEIVCGYLVTWEDSLAFLLRMFWNFMCHLYVMFCESVKFGSCVG